MKAQVILCILVGIIIGASATFYCMRGSPNRPNIVEIAPLGRTSDDPPFLLNDPNDLGQRDLCVALWYADMWDVTYNLEKRTGHKFGPIWNRRSPEEILQEQIAFFKDYRETCRKIEEAQKAKLMNSK